jgi:hypothetical protein
LLLHIFEKTKPQKNKVTTPKPRRTRGFAFLKKENAIFEKRKPIIQMTFRQVCTVNNNQVVITLPQNFGHHKEVMVVVDDEVDTRFQKMAKLKQAATDPLFLSDIKEIQADFDAIDPEVV